MNGTWSQTPQRGPSMPPRQPATRGMIQVLVVGLGAMGQRHALAYAALDGFQIGG